MNFVWSWPVIAFYIIALLTLCCGVIMLSVRKVIYMALTIGGVFIGASALYFLLGADFVGVAQILIYAGAITILIMFAIMLTNHEATEPAFKWSAKNIAAAIGSVLLAVVLLLAIRSTAWPTATTSQTALDGGNSNPMAIGLVMFKGYAIPFELVSILLIVALVGAVILAKERKEDE